ncbi:MAG: DNA polymerase III subunit delta [Elusimicrobiota bacterium]
MAREASGKELAQAWKKGDFKYVYLWLGEDLAAKSLAVTELKEALQPGDLDYAEFSGAEDAHVPEIISACQTPPMFSRRRMVVVRDADFGAAAKRDLAAHLKSPADTAVLVLLSEEKRFDFKDPLAVAVEKLGGLANFKALGEGEAVSRLQQEAARAGFELCADAAELLVSEAGSEWGILRGELEKVRLYVEGRGKAGAEEVAACLGYRRQTGPFELQNAIEERNARKALALVRRLLREEGEDPFAVYNQVKNAVSRQFKVKRLAAAGKTPDEINRESRVPVFRQPLVGKLSDLSLQRALKACLEAEVSLKSESWLSPEVELQRLVLRICGLP